MKKLVIKAHSNSDAFYPDFAILNITDKLKKQVKKASSFLSENEDLFYISTLNSCFEFYNNTIQYGNNEGELIKNKTINKVVNSGNILSIKITDEKEEELPQMDCRLEMYGIKIYKNSIVLVANCKYDYSIEYYSEEIPLKYIL